MGKCMNRKIADSKKKMIYYFLYFKGRFQDCKRKHMLYRIYTLNDTDIFVEN